MTSSIVQRKSQETDILITLFEFSSNRSSGFNWHYFWFTSVNGHFDLFFIYYSHQRMTSIGSTITQCSHFSPFLLNSWLNDSDRISDTTGRCFVELVPEIVIRTSAIENTRLTRTINTHWKYLDQCNGRREDQNSWEVLSRFSYKSCVYIQYGRDLDWWNIVGPIGFEACLNFTITCRQGFYWPVFHAGYGETVPDYIMWFARRLTKPMYCKHKSFPARIKCLSVLWTG